MLDMGTLVFARRARWVDGGIFTRTSKGTAVVKASGHRFRTVKSNERGIRERIVAKERQQMNVVLTSRTYDPVSVSR